MCWSGFKYSWCWGLLTVYRCAVVLRLKSSTTVLLQPFNRMSNRPGGLNTLQAGWAFMTRGNRKGFCVSQRGSHSFKYFGAIHTQRQEEWLMCFLATTTAARQQYSGKINTAFIDGSTRSKSVMSLLSTNQLWPMTSLWQVWNILLLPLCWLPGQTSRISFVILSELQIKWSHCDFSDHSFSLSFYHKAVDKW